MNDRGRRRERRRDDRPRDDRPRDDRRRDDRPKQNPTIAPIVRPRRLDLTRPAHEPLSPEEVQEAKEHLNYLRRFKAALRLSLNASEDLLVQGVKPPDDRGTLKHLLSKIDRNTVQRALEREPLRNDEAQKAALLAGLVRIDPDPGLLLQYLEALSATADRRDAARAFSITVDRIDFSSLAKADLARLLLVIARTFSAHDRIQALFGVLGSESMRAALPSVLPQLDEELRALFGPLLRAHEVIFEGKPPPRDDEAAGDALIQGVRMLLAAPDHVLRSYPLEVRARVATLAIEGAVDDPSALEATRRILDSLPAKDESFTRLRMARVDQIFRTEGPREAKPLLNQIVSAHPDSTWAKRRLEAISWQHVGRVTVEAGGKEGSKLRKGFWLDGSCFAWVRTGPPDQAARLSAEARLQADLHLPGIAPVMAHGLGKDGTVYIALPAVGRRLAGPPFKEEAPLADRLHLALEGVRILRALVVAGIEIPDLDWPRLVLIPSSPPAIMLADFEGAAARDPAAAAIALTQVASRWVRRVLGDDTPAKLRRSTPLPVLARTLVEHLAREQSA